MIDVLTVFVTLRINSNRVGQLRESPTPSHPFDSYVRHQVSHPDVPDTDAAVSRSVAVTTPLEIGGSSSHSRMDSGSSYRKSSP